MSRPVGPYTPIVRAGGFLVASGQLGIVDGALVEGGVRSQVAQAVANVAGLLEGEGAALTDVVKTTLFLADMGDYAEVNDAYTTAFGSHRPARTAVAVAALPLGAAIEVEAWAWVGDGAPAGAD